MQAGAIIKREREMTRLYLLPGPGARRSQPRRQSQRERVALCSQPARRGVHNAASSESSSVTAALRMIDACFRHVFEQKAAARSFRPKDGKVVSEDGLSQKFFLATRRLSHRLETTRFMAHYPRRRFDCRHGHHFLRRHEGLKLFQPVGSLVSSAN